MVSLLKNHPKMHMYAQCGHIITNYVMILAIILVIWPESHETSNMIVHFEKECDQRKDKNHHIVGINGDYQRE